MATFTSKYGLGDTVYFVAEFLHQEGCVRGDHVVAVKHTSSGTMYMLQDADNGWYEEKRLYSTMEEAQEHFREEMLECHRDDLKHILRELEYHERSASNARDQARSLQEKIKKLEEENGATEKEAQVQSR